MKSNFLENMVITENLFGFVATGNIYNDEKMRFEDGKFIRTSPIVKICSLGRQIITENTTYNYQDLLIKVVGLGVKTNVWGIDEYLYLEQ